MVNVRRLTRTQLNEIGFNGNVTNARRELQEYFRFYNFTGRNFRTYEDLRNFKIEEDANILRIKRKRILRKLVRERKARKEIRRRGFKRFIVSREDKNNIHYIYQQSQFTGRVRYIVYEDGRVIIDRIFNITKLSKWWRNEGFLIFMYDSDNTIFSLEPEKKHEVIITKEENLTPNELYQSFRDGIKHCVLYPIKSWATSKKEDAKSNSTVKRYNYLENKITELEKLYENGIPEDKIVDICNLLNIDIEISDILRQNVKRYKSLKKPLRKFTYINTRENHLDEYVNSSIDDNIILNEEDMKILFKELTDKNEYFVYMGQREKPHYIMTKSDKYKLYNEDNELINNFFTDNELFKYKMSYNNDKNLFDFISKGVNFSSHQNFNNKLTEDLHEVDMKKAYTQFKSCKYYMEFPTVMSPVYELNDYTIEDIKKYAGYYEININDTSLVNENTKKIFEHIGIIKGRYILDSPFILFLYDLNYKFEITKGTFCYDTVDFEFSEEIINKKLYSKITGKMNMFNDYNHYKMNSNLRFAEHLAGNYDINFNRTLNELVINVESKSNCNYQHIAGYITSYCRINTLTELLKINFEDIYGFKLDGFIYKGDYNFSDLFLNKEVKCNFNWGDSLFEQNNIEFYAIDKPRDQYIILTGQGGTGKTFDNLTNRNGILYCSYNWALATSKNKEFNVKSASIHKVLGLVPKMNNCCKDTKCKKCKGKGEYFDINQDGESFLNNNLYPNTIFIDELTHFDNTIAEKFRERFPLSQLIFAGDIDEDGFAYQCKFKGVENLIDVSKYKLYNYSNNYRCKDKELMNRMLKIRDVMKNTDGDNKIIYKKFLHLFKDRFIYEENMNYNYEKDWILVSTTNSVNSLTKYYSNKFKGKKYICKRHEYGDIVKRFQGMDSYLTGDIVIDNNDELINNKKFNQQDAFTIHGFQGKTIKKGSKMFIDMKSIFDYAQLYTAISRVEYLSQIFVIVN